MKKERKNINNMAQAAAMLGTSPKLITIIKQQYPDAFNLNQTINYEKLKHYYEANKDRLIAELGKSTNLKDKKLSNDIILQELEIAKKRGKMIDIDELELFLVKLGSGVGNVLLGKLVNELPNRINSTESSKRVSLCKDLYNEIVNKFKNDIAGWLKEYKEQTDESK